MRDCFEYDDDVLQQSVSINVCAIVFVYVIISMNVSVLVSVYLRISNCGDVLSMQQGEDSFLLFGPRLKSSCFKEKQGRIHGNPVADGLAGAVRKPLGIQKCDGPTDRPTDRPTQQGVESRVRVLQLVLSNF